MKCIIYRKRKGQNPLIYDEGINLKSAKESLSRLYMEAIETSFQNMTELDRLESDGKTLHLFDYEYFIEKDTRL